VVFCSSTTPPTGKHIAKARGDGAQADLDHTEIYIQRFNGEVADGRVREAMRG
jgi:hypothetical protein